MIDLFRKGEQIPHDDFKINDNKEFNLIFQSEFWWKDKEFNIIFGDRILYEK